MPVRAPSRGSALIHNRFPDAVTATDNDRFARVGGRCACRRRCPNDWELTLVALSLDQSLALREDALFRELGGEGVILDLASGRYFGVDRVGARVWQLLGEGASLRHIHARLLDEFDVSPDVLERDLLAFAEQLLARGLGTAAER